VRSTRFLAVACSVGLASCVVAGRETPSTGSSRAAGASSSSGSALGASDGGCQGLGGPCETSQDCCGARCGAGGTCRPFEPEGIACQSVDAACAVGADCCSGHCSVLGFCNNGYPVVCETAADCPYATTCLTCINQCVYPPFGACDQAAPCPCGYTCLNHVCASAEIDAGQRCATSVDCPLNQDCNPHTSQCQYTMCMNVAGGPVTDAGPAEGWVSCNLDGGPTGCADGFQCTDIGSGNSACQRPCNTNADCGSGEVCGQSGSSSTGQVCNYDCSSTCANNSDCSGNERCESGNCVGFGC
jgi:hypothetical protein